MEQSIKKKRMIAISSKKLALSAYLYMVIPIVIFFIGWLKVWLGIGLSGILLYGLYFLITRRYQEEEYFYIEIKGIVLLSAVVAVWIFMTGIGGYFYQRWDWHTRNAILRDLIDYSWPVIYPETGNALVYYYVFWMVPALVGKALGWAAANLTLYIWSVVGIGISMLLLCRLFSLYTTKKILILLYVYIGWGGLNLLGAIGMNVFGFGGTLMGGYFGWPDAVTGYQYTPNSCLLEWVFNQVIVPWVAIPLFLQDQRLDTLAYVGLCVLPFAPMPFVGLFILLAVWAVSQIVEMLRRKNGRQLLKLLFSVPNMTAVLSIFPVFLFFFQCNVAANNDSGRGGIGWYIQPENFSKTHLVVLMVFYILEFLVYSAVLYQENKRNLLFYAANLLLIVCPLVRIGEGRDFCMRASIPPLFLLMILVIRQLIKAWEEKLSFRTFVLISFLVISALSAAASWGEALNQFIVRRTYPIIADNTVTFCCSNIEDSGDSFCVNYLAPLPEETFFYRCMARRKSEKVQNQDLATARTYKERRGLTLTGGHYKVSPKLDSSMSLAADETAVFLEKGDRTLYLTALPEGKYRLRFLTVRTAMDVPGCVVDEQGTIGIWEDLQDSPAQKFDLEEAGDFYRICYGEYALTYDFETHLVSMKRKDDSDSQLWSFTK